MAFQPGYLGEERIVHLTITTLVAEALCGTTVDADGEPDLPLLCEECDRLATAAAGPSNVTWRRLAEPVPAHRTRALAA